jgi:DNA-binding beta-propeller fold protein YncE
MCTGHSVLTLFRAGALTSLLAVAASPAVSQEIIYKVTYDLLETGAVFTHSWSSGQDKQLSGYKSIKCGDERLLVAFAGFREPSLNLDNFVTELSGVCRRYGSNQGRIPYGVADLPPKDNSIRIFSAKHRDSPSLKTEVEVGGNGNSVPTGVHLEVNANDYVKDINFIYRRSETTGLAKAEANTRPMAGLSGKGVDLRCLEDFALTGADVKYSMDNGKIRVFEIKCRQLVHVPLTATSTAYPTQDRPFEALSTGSGQVLVSVTPGVQVFAPVVSSCMDVPRGCGNNAQSGAPTVGLPGTIGKPIPSTTPVPNFPSATSALHSSCVDSFPSPAHNLRLAPWGTDIGIGTGDAAIFYKLDDIIECKKNATGIAVDQGAGAGTLDVAFTPDGQFAFVSNEYGKADGIHDGSIGVVKIERDNGGHVAAGTHLLGMISTAGSTIAGMTISRDGKRLYVSSEVSAGKPPGNTNPVLYDDNRCTQANKALHMGTGLLTVIDVAKATKRQDAEAIINTAAAGCSPTRIAVTRDGTTLWVTARGDNSVLAFDTAKLEMDPDKALIGHSNTGGAAPVGLALFYNEKFLAVANSNRFGDGEANATILSVADPAAISVVATISTGKFPREITVGSNDATLYLTDFDSASFQVIHTTVH